MSLPIEHCRSWFRFICPRTWDQLRPTETPGVRHCGVCGKDIYTCETAGEVESHRIWGHCVVIQINMNRSQEVEQEIMGDLLPPA